MMTISTDMANSACAKIERNDVVVPQGLTKTLLLLEWQTMSTTIRVRQLRNSFHGTSISVTQHMPGTDCGSETPLIDSTMLGKLCVLPLPSTCTLVPEVEVKKNISVCRHWPLQT